MLGLSRTLSTGGKRHGDDRDGVALTVDAGSYASMADIVAGLLGFQFHGSGVSRSVAFGPS